MTTDTQEPCRARCPFEDCDWVYEYDPDDYDSELRKDHEAERHYERVHAGRIRVLAAVEVEPLMGARDPEDVREAVMERLEDQGHEVAWVQSEVLEQPDDHEKTELQKA